MKTQSDDEAERVREIVRRYAADESLMALRHDLAAFSSATFVDVGQQIHLQDYIFGDDRKHGASPFGHDNDEAVGVSVLLRIGGQLVSASADLLVGSRPYAGAALLRQIVEIEYLAWAFETRDGDAERWLRSDQQIREDFFRPAKLRKAAQGKFRGKDYGYHCELGGHPVPLGTILLSQDREPAQLLLSDLLGHTGGIWNHLVGWGRKNDPYGLPILKKAAEMSSRFKAWSAVDPLFSLPAPP